jgi:DMSO reductase iron-sulfur subunit
LHELAHSEEQSPIVRVTENGLEFFTPEPPRRAQAHAGQSASLIPDRPLEQGEQYRFHFNVTKCIGCRSCEVACNEQNGNPADIRWRRVGEIEGGIYPDTLRHYLSMGCNHCMDAECVKGCPVDAYTKDPVTGIVLHSADACIGCQYCVWNCPYSVPQFNQERGVVGKCDMCKGRLEDGREPACVNACPEGAIEIEIVNMAAWRENFTTAESPGMPPAEQTISTTRITLPQDTGAPLERVDTAQIQPEHSHLPLVYMTAMMQAVSGAMWILLLWHELNAVRLAVLVGITALALNLSTLHLGRPAYAWRALKMWRRSWLSREVLLFTLFFGALAAATVTTFAGSPPRLIALLDWSTAILGLLGTVASAAIYLVRARPAWNTGHTPLDFLLTGALLGSLLAAALAPASPARAGWLVGAAATAWLGNQVLRALRLRRSQAFEANAAFALMAKFRLHIAAMMVLLVASVAAVALGQAVAALACGFVAVLCARYLFFVSVVPLNMALTFVRSRHA